MTVVKMSDTRSAAVSRCRWNRSGTRFGACDMDGYLALWKFPVFSAQPYFSLKTHSVRTIDFAFLNSGTLIATAGVSSEMPRRSVCMWDTLMPTNSAMVHTFGSQEDAATSLAYSQRHQLLVAGMKDGGIYIYDVRKRGTVKHLKAHDQNAKSLSIDAEENFFVSGSTDGSIKVWDLPSLEERQAWNSAHEKKAFFSTPFHALGVLEVGVCHDAIYSCGADGRLTKRPFTVAVDED